MYRDVFIKSGYEAGIPFNYNILIVAYAISMVLLMAVVIAFVIMMLKTTDRSEIIGFDSYGNPIYADSCILLVSNKDNRQYSFYKPYKKINGVYMFRLSKAGVDDKFNVGDPIITSLCSITEKGGYNIKVLDKK